MSGRFSESSKKMAWPWPFGENKGNHRFDV